MIAENVSAGTGRPDSSVPSEQEKAPTQSVPASDTDPALVPQTLAGIFDGAFDIYKRHFVMLALIVAVVFIPTQVFLHAASNLWLRPLSINFRGDARDPIQTLQIMLLAFFLGVPTYGIPGFLSLLTSFMASGPVAVAVANILLKRPVTIASAYRRRSRCQRQTWISCRTTRQGAAGRPGNKGRAWRGIVVVVVRPASPRSRVRPARKADAPA